LDQIDVVFFDALECLSDAESAPPGVSVFRYHGADKYGFTVFE